jgi:hypothetical protein
MPSHTPIGGQLSNPQSPGRVGYAAAARLVAMALSDAVTWPWTTTTLRDLNAILTTINAAADTADEQLMWRAYSALVELSESLRIAAQPVDDETHPSESLAERFPHERVNVLVDRLHPRDLTDATDDRTNSSGGGQR